MRSAKEANMARPTKSEPRCKQLKFCLTANELDNIKRRAEAVGMRPVHFGRALLLAQENKNTPKNSPEKNPPENNDYQNNHIHRLIYGQLVRLGNLLNQMMRHCHRTGDAPPKDLEPLLKDIRQIIARVQP